jgi:hypothetical protein
MSSSVRQYIAMDPVPSNGSGTVSGGVNGFLITSPTATLLGSTIIVFAACASGAGSSVTGVTDSNSGTPNTGTYTSIDHRNHLSIAGEDNGTYYLQNAASIPAGDRGAATGGSTTTLIDSTKAWSTNQWAGKNVYDQTNGTTVSVISNTATTLTFAATTAVAAGHPYAVGGYVRVLMSGFDDYNAAIVIEATGVVTTGGLAGHNSGSGALVSGTDNATSGTAALGANPVLVIGFGINETETCTTWVPATGTGFTSLGTSWQWDTAQVALRTEYKNVANPGTMAATFSPSGSDTYDTFMVALTDSGGAAAVPWFGQISI